VSDWFVVACRSFFSRGADLTVVLLLSLQQESLHYTTLHDNQTESTKGVERVGGEKGEKTRTEIIISRPPIDRISVGPTVPVSFCSSGRRGFLSGSALV
jgi:hypothetical protein